MTVAFYNSRENGVDINSGRGYTRDEKIKPDYAAPGEAVTGAVPGGEFKNRTGSSAATAIAAGGCALIMEWISEQPGARGVSSSQKYYRDGNTKASGNRISEYTMGIWDDEFVPIIGYFKTAVKKNEIRRGY